MEWDVDDLFVLGIVWREGGVLHIDIPKVIRYLGYPVTEENKDLAIQALKEVVEELRPGMPFFVVRSDGSGEVT